MPADVDVTPWMNLVGDQGDIIIRGDQLEGRSSLNITQHHSTSLNITQHQLEGGGTLTASEDLSWRCTR
jgi:hypothetical protein